MSSKIKEWYKKRIIARDITRIVLSSEAIIAGFNISEIEVRESAVHVYNCNIGDETRPSIKITASQPNKPKSK